MNLLRSLMRSWYSPTAWSMNYGGVTYPLGLPQQTLGFREEVIEPSYTSFAQLAYKSNPIVFACMETRRSLFSEARFTWRQVRGGTPGRFFGTTDLALLEKPWPNATTGDLLSRVIQDADLAGNAFVIRKGQRLIMLRPDWMTIIAASEQEPEQGLAAIDADIVGYAYYPGGRGYAEPEFLLPEEVAHFAPTPDPLARFRGMSWLSPLIREVMADQAASALKLGFFERGATPNMVVRLDKDSAASQSTGAFKSWVDEFKKAEPTGDQAYKTLYLAAGADVTVVGANLRQIDFKAVQGAGETRIAAAAGVPPAIVGLSEGLQGSSLNASTYGAARRRFSDGTIWPLWANIAGSLESILPPPPGAQLWVDGRNIPFLQEDERDRAEIQQMDASAINTLVTAGYDPVSVVDAVTAGDLSRLEHSGLYSVQLQAPGSEQTPDVEEDARQRLVASGIARPTAAQVAAELGVSERTLRRWRVR